MVSAIRSGAVRSAWRRKDRDRELAQFYLRRWFDHYARQACARVTARKELRDALGESMFEMTIQGSSSELFMKTVILAEDKPEAGLTQDARFPMMKKLPKSVTTETQRHGETQGQGFRSGAPPWLRASVVN